MTDKKFDDEIIKGLKRMSEEDPNGFSADVLDLINRQKAEVDSAKSKIKICAEAIDRQDKEIGRLKKRISDIKHTLFEQQAYTAELQNEIVKLKDYNENLLAANTALSNEILSAKVEAYKEFAKWLKERKTQSTMDKRICTNEMIDNLLKEMVGEK